MKKFLTLLLVFAMLGSVAMAEDIGGAGVFINGTKQGGAGGDGTPGGSNKEVQFNNAGSFEGIDSLTVTGSTVTYNGVELNTGGVSDGDKGDVSVASDTWTVESADDDFIVGGSIGINQASPSAKLSIKTIMGGDPILDIKGGFSGTSTLFSMDSYGTTYSYGGLKLEGGYANNEDYASLIISKIAASSFGGINIYGGTNSTGDSIRIYNNDKTAILFNIDKDADIYTAGSMDIDGNLSVDSINAAGITLENTDGNIVAGGTITATGVNITGTDGSISLDTDLTVGNYIYVNDNGVIRDNSGSLEFSNDSGATWTAVGSGSGSGLANAYDTAGGVGIDGDLTVDGSVTTTGGLYGASVTATGGVSGEDLTADGPPIVNFTDVTEYAQIQIDGTGIIDLTSTGTIMSVRGDTSIEGNLTAGIKSLSVSGDREYTEAEMRGTIVDVDGDGSVQTLPAVFDGANIAFNTIGDIEFYIDVQDEDKFWLQGTALTDGQRINNLSTSGNTAVIYYHSEDGYSVIAPNFEAGV